MRRRISRARLVALVSSIVLVTHGAMATLGHAADPAEPVGLQKWAFLVGEWNLIEKRYGFDGALIQTNSGQARFSHVMNGQRIQEVQTLPRGDDEGMTALHLFVYDPRSKEIEIARPIPVTMVFRSLSERWRMVKSTSSKSIPILNPTSHVA